MTVSIILPTYNRAGFLPDAFSAIEDQTFHDWELIVVDDGSTDETSTLVEEFGKRVAQPVRYFHQKNAGAYAARNTGLDHAIGEYIAFYDSDDIWLPHHLEKCVEVLDNCDDVDWVFGLMHTTKMNSKELACETSFPPDKKKRQFFELSTEPREDALRINDSRAVEIAISVGFGGPLQVAVIRSAVFANYRFDEQYRNGQDRFAIYLALLSGFHFAYFTEVHLIYRIHSQNDSLAASSVEFSKQVNIEEQLISQYEELLSDKRLTSKVKRALRKKLLSECFWCLGYSVQLAGGRQQDALQSFRRGLSHWMWSVSCWKTYFVCCLRYYGFHLWSKN